MAVSGPIDLEGVVDSWRRTLGNGVRLRGDDVEEMCDHFRESVRAHLRAGASLAVAVEDARRQFGPVDALVDEMGRVQRPPIFFRRWCALLVAFTVVQSIWVMLRISSSMMRVVQATDMSFPVSRPMAFTVTAVLVGGGLTVGIAARFGLLRGGIVLRRAGNGLVPFIYIASLGFVLFVGVALIEYWDWWLATVQLGGVPQPWGSVTYTLFAFVIAPVLALTTATLLARWHPALEGSKVY